MRAMQTFLGGLVLAFCMSSCTSSAIDTVRVTPDLLGTSTPRSTYTPVVVSTESAASTSLPTQINMPPTIAPTNTLLPSPTSTSTLLPASTRAPKNDADSGTHTTVDRGMDRIFGRYPCIHNGTIVFNSSFFPPSLITAILPMGKVAPKNGHVTPTDHLYIHRDSPLGEDVDYVLAPADGFVVDIARFSSDQPLIAGDQSSPKVPDYRVIFMHSCSFFTMFIHLGELAPAIAEKTGEIALNDYWFARNSSAIEVKSGQAIAKFGGDSFDWSVHDADTTLPSFVVPAHYQVAPWKIHTVDPFQFYDEPWKSDLLSKVVRTIEPRAGKIDYDLEGTIAGNWFLDGTVDYSGNRASGSPRYWDGHLFIGYGYIDPAQIRISIGFDTGIRNDLCNICFGAYAVRGNQPDPAMVHPESGIIKYELMSRFEESRWIREQVGDTSLGTFLVQHLGDQTIIIEVIPDKYPGEVSGFSENARIYRR